MLTTHNLNSHRSSQAKHIGKNTDQDVHVVTVVGKLEEIRDIDLSSTEPAMAIDDLTGKLKFKPTMLRPQVGKGSREPFFRFGKKCGKEPIPTSKKLKYAFSWPFCG